MEQGCNGNSSSEEELQDEERPEVREDGIGGDADLIPLYQTENMCRPRPFVETQEWKWTKETCEGLFRSVAKYYNELWFPTVLLEWCLLYYRSNYHDNDYWGRRDSWLQGDPEIRMAVWGEILKYFTQRDQMIWSRSDRQNQDSQFKERLAVCKLHKAVDLANDTIVMKRMTMEDVARCRARPKPRVPTKEERERAFREKLELAAADPSEDLNWVEMRRLMRGAMSAFNIARCKMSHKILKHLMFELCLYWSKLPPLCDQLEPCLERNIVREIRNFRNQLFGAQAFIKSDREEQQPYMDPFPRLCPEPCPEPDNACSLEPLPCPAPCPEPCPAPCPEPCPTAGPSGAGPSGVGPSGAGPSGAGPSKRPKRKTSGCRPPATNKLVEARARQVAQRMRDRENKDKNR